jgi:hypothetical protein
MASAFVTALFLTFLSMLSPSASDPSSSVSGSAGRERVAGWAPLVLSYLALLFSYGVFVSGIYVNLFVTGAVFSLPLNSESAAFTQAERSVPFVIHEALGAALLVTLALLTTSLWFVGTRKLSLASAVPVLLVAYSAYVGSLNLTSPLAPVSSAGVLPVLVPMVSAAGFMGAIVITMLLTLRVRSNGPQR